MPIGLNVNNPQSQVSVPTVTTDNTVSFAGNALGTGASTTSGVSNILIYGCIALVIIFILKKI